ncbi:GNAT family N-acetyltransferase [Rhizobium ruizarguesonis]
MALKAIRASVVENVLDDPFKVTDADYEWYVRNPGVSVWEEDGEVVGFSAADPRNGNIWAIFVVPRFERNGIGSILLAEACACLKSAGIRMKNRCGCVARWWSPACRKTEKPRGPRLMS